MAPKAQETNPTPDGVVVDKPSRYLVIIEAGDDSYSAYVPDLPRCIAAAETRQEVESLIREGIVLYLATLCERNESVPAPTTSAVEIAVPAA